MRDAVGFQPRLGPMRIASLSAICVPGPLFGKVPVSE